MVMWWCFVFIGCVDVYVVTYTSTEAHSLVNVECIKGSVFVANRTLQAAVSFDGQTGMVATVYRFQLHLRPVEEGLDLPCSTHSHTHAHTLTHISTHTHTHMHTHMHTHTHTHT